MSTISKQKLSDSTDGRPVAVAATASPGTDIHTAVTGTTDWDEIWLWATNISASDVDLTLEWGSTGDGVELWFVVPAKSTIPIAAGWLLQNATDVAAYASVASKVNIIGYVNRIDVS